MSDLKEILKEIVGISYDLKFQFYNHATYYNEESYSEFKESNIDILKKSIDIIHELNNTSNECMIILKKLLCNKKNELEKELDKLKGIEK